MDKFTLKLRQSMPLKDKIRFTQRRIREWVEHFGVNGCYVSFSGGKDSTVLLHIVRELYPDIEAVFVDTGLEYPEIRKFVKTFDNVTILRPEMRFDKVLEKYGYPIVSKEISSCVEQAKKNLKEGKKTWRLKRMLGKLTNADGTTKSIFNHDKWKYLLDSPFKISDRCCYVMKKRPAYLYRKQTGKKIILGTMAEESKLREVQYIKSGCNAFNNKIPTSTPIAFWTEQDVLQYIYENKIPIASVYGDVIKTDKYHTTGCQRTGCMFCGFGCHLEKYPNRFQRLAETHPRQYDYIINTLGMGKVLDYIGVEYRPKINKGQLKLL